MIYIIYPQLYSLFYIIKSGGNILPKKSKSGVELMASDRRKRIAELNKLMEESGEGLMKSQIEVKHVPWHVTWERQDMLIERQERIIELLEEILKSLKKK
jgi:hypothetical protein